MTNARWIDPQEIASAQSALNKLQIELEGNKKENSKHRPFFQDANLKLKVLAEQNDKAEWNKFNATKAVADLEGSFSTLLIRNTTKILAKKQVIKDSQKTLRKFADDTRKKLVAKSEEMNKGNSEAKEEKKSETLEIKPVEIVAEAPKKIEPEILSSTPEVESDKTLQSSITTQLEEIPQAPQPDETQLKSEDSLIVTATQSINSASEPVEVNLDPEEDNFPTPKYTAENGQSHNFNFQQKVSTDDQEEAQSNTNEEKDQPTNTQAQPAPTQARTSPWALAFGALFAVGAATTGGLMLFSQIAMGAVLTGLALANPIGWCCILVGLVAGLYVLNKAIQSTDASVGVSASSANSTSAPPSPNNSNQQISNGLSINVGNTASAATTPTSKVTEESKPEPIQQNVENEVRMSPARPIA